MTQMLANLNKTSPGNAFGEFTKCCGSKRWAQEMTAARPFANIAQLLNKAEDVWWSLDEDDWLEAFRSHPKIGEKRAAVTHSEQAQSWPAEEQARVARASVETATELAEKNREYEVRFGFIFIVCATGKSAGEMLTILNKRLHHDARTELRIAAAEQAKITRLRLEKLLNQ